MWIQCKENFIHQYETAVNKIDTDRCIRARLYSYVSHFCVSHNKKKILFFCEEYCRQLGGS